MFQKEVVFRDCWGAAIGADDWALSQETDKHLKGTHHALVTALTDDQTPALVHQTSPASELVLTHDQAPVLVKCKLRPARGAGSSGD